MKKTKTALIGCGRIGFLLENDPLRNKPCTHYGGVIAAGLKIGSACDINSDRLLLFSKIAKLPELSLYSDYKKLVLEQRPDLVIIATWTNTHAEIAEFASRKGVKSIVCEKPITPGLREAKSLLSTVKKYGTSLIINHERRYDTRYRIVKQILDSGRIGKIKTVTASILSPTRTNNSNFENGGGPLLHDGTHLIDIIRYFFGDIASVKGEIRNKKGNFEHRAVAWLKTRTDVDIFLEAGGSRKYFVFELQISGEEGKIVIGNGYQNFFLNEKSKYYKGFRDLAEKPFPPMGIKNINYFKREYIEVKRILNGNSSEITSGGYDGYKAIEAVHAIYLSSHLKGKQVDLPIKPDDVDLKKIFGFK